MTGITYTQNKLAEKFGYNDYSRQAGLIAQQVQVSVPEVVEAAPFDHDNKSGQNYLTIRYDRLVPIVVQAIKEQQVRIDVLMKKLENRSK